MRPFSAPHTIHLRHIDARPVGAPPSVPGLGNPLEDARLSPAVTRKLCALSRILNGEGAASVLSPTGRGMACWYRSSMLNGRKRAAWMHSRSRWRRDGSSAAYYWEVA
jgi:hypothetical protein